MFATLVDTFVDTAGCGSDAAGDGGEEISETNHKATSFEQMHNKGCVLDFSFGDYIDDAASNTDRNFPAVQSIDARYADLTLQRTNWEDRWSTVCKEKKILTASSVSFKRGFPLEHLLGDL